jgi:hypothetical protein
MSNQKHDTTSKIDFKKNSQQAIFQCMKQRSRYKKIAQRKSKKLIEEINDHFLTKMNGICPKCGGKLHGHGRTIKGFIKLRCIGECHTVYNANKNTIFHNLHIEL